MVVTVAGCVQTVKDLSGFGRKHRAECAMLELRLTEKEFARSILS
jgi:hypothetical protein